MGIKLLWTGLAILLAATKWLVVPSAEIVGAVFMIIGLVLLWLDK